MACKAVGDHGQVQYQGVEGVQPVIGVKGGNLEVVQTFEYLGATITKNGRITADTQIRIGIATGALVKMKPIWHSKSIAVKLKIRVMQAIVTASALYGCET